MADVFGYTVELDLSDYIQRSVYMGAYERLESALVKRHLRCGMTFLDIGANIGYYSLMAAAIGGPSSRIIAFEPNPTCFCSLRKTIMDNRIRQITLENLALSDTAGVSELFLPKQSGNNTATMVSNHGGSPVSVAAQTLDEYLEAHNIEHVDFVKIDVEGFEPAVISGAAGSIRSGKIAAILYESSGPWLRRVGTTPEDLYGFLKSLGMRSINEPSKGVLECGNILAKRF